MRVVSRVRQVLSYGLLRKQLFYCLFITLIVIIGWYQLLYQPFYLAADQLAAQIAQTRTERSRLEQLSQQLFVVEMQHHLKQQMLQSQTQQNYISLTEQLSSTLSCLVADDQTTLVCQPQALVSKQWYSKQHVELSLTGAYQMIEHFLSELDKRQIHYSFKKLVIKPVADSISFAITIALYNTRQDI